MTILVIALVSAHALTLCGLWLAVTWPLMQWTIAWLNRREAAALAEIERGDR